ncbi:unnamed protein product [Camellia sinensis]
MASNRIFKELKHLQIFKQLRLSPSWWSEKPAKLVGLVHRLLLIEKLAPQVSLSRVIYFSQVAFFDWWKSQDGRCAETDDILPDGFKLKKEDGVLLHVLCHGQRMPYIWGDDAEDFRPERWLNNGVFQPKSPFKFIAFHVRLQFTFFFLFTEKIIRAYIYFWQKQK